MKMHDVAATDAPVPAGAPVPVQPGLPDLGGVKWLVIESALLDGEHVVIVLEKRWLKEARQANPGRVLYFPPEIRELRRFQDDPDAIKAIHRIKRHFGAWIVPSLKLSTPFPQLSATGGPGHGQP